MGCLPGRPDDDEANIIRSQVIDLTSGQVTYAGELMMRVLGNYLASGNEYSYPDQPVAIHDPATAQKVGQIIGLNLGEGPFAASNGLFNFRPPGRPPDSPPTASACSVCTTRPTRTHPAPTGSGNGR